MTTTEDKIQAAIETRGQPLAIQWGYQSEMLRALALGATPQEVADHFNVTVDTVYCLQRSSVGKATIAHLSGQRDDAVRSVNARITAFMPVALGFLEDIISGNVDGATPGLRARTAENYVARAGYGPITKNITKSETITRDELTHLKALALDAAKDLGIIDVTPTKEAIP